MKNIFKTNSRFAALSEPSNNERLPNNERPSNNERPQPNNERPLYNDHNIFSQKVIDKAKKQRNEDEIQKTVDERNKKLSIDNFPELNPVTNKKPISIIENTQKPTISFSEKLKHVDVIVENNVKQIPYGWAVIKRDPITKKLITEYNKEYENDLKKAELKEQEKWPLKVLDSLVDLYERERDKYIDKWGYDAYETKYLDPDYDDEYFDRLDEAYASETEEDDDEYEEEYEEDYYYWKN